MTKKGDRMRRQYIRLSVFLVVPAVIFIAELARSLGSTVGLSVICSIFVARFVSDYFLDKEAAGAEVVTESIDDI